MTTEHNVSTVENRGIGRIPVALLMLLVPVSVVIFGLAAPALASKPSNASVSESDQKFLVAVRQAGLWEIPAGRQAQQQADSDVVKDVGATIAEQHEQLDAEVSEVAEQLGVALPDQPTRDQQEWLAELSTRWGPEFDQSFAQLLRAAHGTVFSVVAQVRAGTRNDVVREFATHVNDVVNGHMTLLESTGQVDFAALPEAAQTGGTTAVNATHGGQRHGVSTASARTGGEDSGGVDPGLVIAICLVEAGVTVGLLRLLRTR